MGQNKAKIGQETIELPVRMKAALEEYRKRVWGIKLAEGALAAVFGLVISYLLVFCLDRFFDTSAILRAAILLLGSIGMVVLFPLKYHNWVWSHRRLDQVARLLRHKFPRFGDHLLGIVELAQSDFQPGKSIALVQAAMKQVDAELAERDLSDAVPSPQHRRWAWAAGVPVVLVILLMLLIPAAGSNALVRWLMPWRDVERFTFAQLEGDPGVRVVPYAEPFQVVANLKQDSPWKPEAAKARYGKQSPVAVTRDGKSYRFEMPPQTRDGIVSLQVGDARRFIPVEPKMRPALIELLARVQLPGYLQRSEDLVEDVRGGMISLVKGSQVVFKATATRDLAQATLNDRPQAIDGSQVTTESIAVETSTEYHLDWLDQLGLTAREPQVLRVEVRDDEAPNVNINKLKNNRVILSNEVLSFEIQAGDDFGVKKVGLEWQGIKDPIQNPEPSVGEKIAAAGAPINDTMTVVVTFSADREGIPPQSLRLRAYAEDYLPNRGRAYSPYLVVHVLSPAEHNKWIADHIMQWASAAQEVYDMELQLHQINEELMNLSPEALDDPAQKKKIQNQAVAEKANAAKLGALIDMGKELVQEAVKNEEFDAAQLENWAEMLQALDEIAGKQMPSVADLLEQAAAAPGQPTPPPTELPLPSEPGESKPPENPDDSPPEDPLAAPPGGNDLGLEKVDKYGPEGLKPEGLDESPDDPNSEAADVNVDKSEQPKGKPGYIPANPTPLVIDVESGFNKSEKAEDAPQVVGGMLIPTTIIEGSGKEEDEEEKEEEKEESTAELVLQAVTEQQDLLDAFAKLASEMNELLMGFENSTFVKRLKTASRKQIDLAVELNDLDGFGVQDELLDNQSQRKNLAAREIAASETIFTLQEDMDAYADRRPSKNYTRVLEEMQNVALVNEIGDIATAIHKNEVGQSTIEAEFWADTLDRLAEQLVDPLGDAPPAPPSGLIELPNLTPEIILEVIRIINQEIELRKETRELHQSMGGIDEPTYKESGLELSQTQSELAEKSLELIEQIKKLPMQEHALIKKQIEKLTNAEVVMTEVAELLATPAAGSPTIAAISEVIEILLETARFPNAPMVVKASPTTTSALLLMGLGDDDSRAFIEERAPGLATGNSGRKLPEEFRHGLDAYINALEGVTN